MASLTTVSTPLRDGHAPDPLGAALGHGGHRGGVRVRVRVVVRVQVKVRAKMATG